MSGGGKPDFYLHRRKQIYIDKNIFIGRMLTFWAQKKIHFE